MTLAVSELATNAVTHAHTGFDVIITSNGQVRVTVSDGSAVAPVQRSHSALSPGGRGLHVLDAVCDRWGVHVVHDRKCVWCEKDLPRRTDRALPV
jgi:anti-sigma regulatory factor (Ser/Thr protein kinase)